MRSRLLLLLVLVVAVAVLPVGLLPAAASAPARPVTPQPVVRPTIDTVPLGPATVVDESRAARPSVREVSGKHFAMVALRWSGTEAAPTGMQVQARQADGRWTDWFDADQQDGPDGADGRATNGTEPIWVGDSTAVRVRTPEPERVSAVLIDPGVSATDAAPAERSVQSPPVITRAGWGADESIRTDCFARQGIGVDYADTVKAAVIHHTVGTNKYGPGDSARIVRGIYAYHAIDRDWCDIGYNVLVDRYGQVFEGRFGGLDRPVWGAHAGGFNEYTFGVAMLGTFTKAAPTPQQLDAVAGIVAWKLAGSYRDPNGQVTLVSAGGGTSKYPAGTPVTLPTIFGHRDVGSTECPGDAGYAQLPTIRRRVTERMGDWASSPVYVKSTSDSSLGGPFDIERDAANGGRWASFARGSRTIYWSAPTGAHIVQNGILDAWSRHGRETGLLGYPLTDELATPDGIGAYNDFAGANGSIYWSPASGAHVVVNTIKQKWVALGAERGVLGYPVTDELGTADGVGAYNDFIGRGGSIYWHPSSGAHAIYGPIKERWASLGAERSYLGYPIRDEYSVPRGRRSDFQHGYVVWNARTGRVVDRRY